MRYIKEFYRFLKHLKNSRKLILTLAYNDFKEQYLGSYLGILWAVIRPSLFILVLWFVFTMGFRARPTDDGTPFVLWLLCGMIPWFFFAESVNKGMSAIVSNSYLVKKVAFRVSILPLVKVLSALGIHIILVGILMIVFCLHGYYPSLYWLQLPFYIGLTVLLVLGISWLTSSVRVFVKDAGEAIGVVIQFGFWLTPIFWSLRMIPEKYQYIIKLNPMVYVVEGFRDTFIYKTWFWERGFDTVQFALTILFFLIVGAIVFKRLRPHFGDVL
jgi:lipopolysaccharide transport system permease protein